LPSWADHEEEIATDAAFVRADDPQHSVRRDAGVDGVPAILEHAEAGL
jgi:hypothetical protein